MARRVQLVSQFLEDISRDAVSAHRKIIKVMIGKRQGVYALYWRGKLQYVGLASSLARRLNSHLRDKRKRWDRFSVYLTIGPTSMKEMESLLLRIAIPQLNKTKGKLFRAENLRRKFKAEVKATHVAELSALLGDSSRREKVKQMSRGNRVARKKVAVAVLARYVDGAPLKLRARYKGKLFRARVRRDGYILYGGKTYKTPSGAGKVVRRGAIDGWHFWHFERAPGDWVPLAELRR